MQGGGGAGGGEQLLLGHEKILIDTFIIWLLTTLLLQEVQKAHIALARNAVELDTQKPSLLTLTIRDMDLSEWCQEWGRREWTAKLQKNLLRKPEESGKVIHGQMEV